MIILKITEGNDHYWQPQENQTEESIMANFTNFELIFIFIAVVFAIRGIFLAGIETGRQRTVESFNKER